MYNLMVGVTNQLSLDRVGEHTDESVRSYFKPNGQFEPGRVANLPTLLMPEVDGSSEQVARIGHLEDITTVGSGHRAEVRFRFVPNPAYPAIASDRVIDSALQLGITSGFEFHRTHWAVKNVDLYRSLQTVFTGITPSPRVFQLPTHLSREEDLVAVMMPFASEFDSVYEALRGAAVAAGMRCQRADDIWDNDAIMDDVISLIWRARVVISDFSSRNANVFYETGIAHTIGRDVIQVAQSLDDVPFDLKSLRTVRYLANGEGLKNLSERVTSRLRDLARHTS